MTTPNATALSSGSLTDSSPFGLTDVHAVLSVQPPSGTTIPGGAGTPLLAWRVNGSSWQSVSLTWNGISGPGAAWRSTDVDLGFNLSQGSSATVDLETEFVSASPGGQYSDQLTFTAQTCGSQTLGAGLNFSDYEPAASAPTTKAAAPKHTASAAAHPSSPTTPAEQHSATRPAASPSASAKAKPSPSASPLDITFVQVQPSSQPVAAATSGQGFPDGVLAVVAVVFLGGLVCIRTVRRRDNP
ncbi:hypothetical protein KDL01_30155 [Actinospica durhamensis]|uniref:Uncharacterized protein n=1 Tax=Actinospica durhamensis TaxID=1508375 RepID=A0A941IVP9_9ACTN|nr:hypothetical protein [Actinospica durhamensis]MBR7837581.1 hypothetical protein [Actinospica durhamensis]